MEQHVDETHREFLRNSGQIDELVDVVSVLFFSASLSYIKSRESLEAYF